MIRFLRLSLTCRIILLLQICLGEFVYLNSAEDEPDHGVRSGVCWTTSDCLIAASLDFYSGYSLPITVNCSTGDKYEQNDTLNSVVKRRYEGVRRATLDGCGAALNANTFGFEYIPNCEQITSLNLKNFHFDEIYEIICQTGIALEDVRFEYNELARITATSLVNLRSLTTLYFYKNKFRYIDAEAFNELQQLRELSVIEETYIRIRSAKIFRQLLQLEKLHISDVNRITNELFVNLPDNLIQLTINKSPLESDKLIIDVPKTLNNLSITNCALNVITIKGNDLPLYVNLSSNQLKEFILENCSNIEMLDLSQNRLDHLDASQFTMLHQLKHIYLNGNKLKTLSLLGFGEMLSRMNTIDLRNNRLKQIRDITDTMLLNSHLRIFIDGNPWNCIWLVNISYNMPEQYRVLVYEKYISKINVNGLECVTYPLSEAYETFTEDHKNLSTAFTIVYGVPRETKRNQKAEALVIVFMLPLGIAILFVLLYLWINCQKVFHLSYYRNLPLVRGSAERFDVVRQIPPGDLNALTNNQGYEIPISGCNCTDHGDKKCNNVNLTYGDVPPQQEAAKVYEEILESGTGTGNCYYEHLKFLDQEGKLE